jgi:hypothetical protein
MCTRTLPLPLPTQTVNPFQQTVAPTKKKKVRYRKKNSKYDIFSCLHSPYYKLRIEYDAKQTLTDAQNCGTCALFHCYSRVWSGQLRHTGTSIDELAATVNSWISVDLAHSDWMQNENTRRKPSSVTSLVNVVISNIPTIIVAVNDVN